jgi:hypothetical protein
MIGKRFGRLVVIAKCDLSSFTRHSRWICRCDCGKEVEVTSKNLGVNTNSCGCLRSDSLRERWKNYRLSRVTS